MSFPLPSNKPSYTAAQLHEFEKVGRARRQAALFGVPEQLLYLSDPGAEEFESFSIHTFQDILLSPSEHEANGSDELKAVRHTARDQEQDIKELLEGGLYRNPPSAILINAYPNYFSSAGWGSRKDWRADKSGSGLLFLYHLLGATAIKLAGNRIKSVDVSILETNLPFGNQPFDLKANHIVIWGPCTHNFLKTDFHKTQLFLQRYENYTRILMTSVPFSGTIPIANYLVNFGASVHTFDYIFNMDTTMPPPKKCAVRQRASARKKRAVDSLTI